MHAMCRGLQYCSLAACMHNTELRNQRSKRYTFNFEQILAVGERGQVATKIRQKEEVLEDFYKYSTANNTLLGY